MLRYLLRIYYMKGQVNFFTQQFLFSVFISLLYITFKSSSACVIEKQLRVIAIKIILVNRTSTYGCFHLFFEEYFAVFCVRHAPMAAVYLFSTCGYVYRFKAAVSSRNIHIFSNKETRRRNLFRIPQKQQNKPVYFEGSVGNFSPKCNNVITSQVVPISSTFKDTIGIIFLPSLSGQSEVKFAVFKNQFW